MKKYFLLVIIILVLSSISAMVINEVELNPEGSDSGNEWIEFYNENSINLSSYSIKNNDGGEIILNGSFSGYYVLILSSQWLDNTDEKVFLYKNGELIHETDIFEDSKNDGFAFSYCDEEWIFIESTKGEENNCPGGGGGTDPPTNETEDDPPDTEPPPEEEEVEEEENEPEVKFSGEVIKNKDSKKDSLEPIRLNSPALHGFKT